MSIYDQKLPTTAANHIALTPLSFIERSASVYPDHPAVIHGEIRRSWRETYARCRRLASALAGRGIGPGDTVAAMLPNVPEMLELHFGVAMAQAVLNTLNIRLEARSIAYMLEHGEARAVVVDREFSAVIREALGLIKRELLIIEVDDPLYTATAEPLSALDYESLLAEGDPDFNWHWPEDEWQAISLNYTSGTTGMPKGVVYHHRGAFLNALGNLMSWSMPMHPVYLWTLPMFHCNGWCFPWAITAQAGTHVCLRSPDPRRVLELIKTHRVSHLCGAPVVFNGLVNLPERPERAFDHPVEAMVAGAPPPARVIGAVEALGIRLLHTYGLTETYGPVTACAWHAAWEALPLEQRANLKARQGVRYSTLEALRVVDPQSLAAVPSDGETLGEVVMRGNTVMKGYLKDVPATEAAFLGGWLHTGDLAVVHPDGYIEIRDRLKDIVISGGENVSTIEVESVLYHHPAVLEASVVAQPDERWGETPCAFVTLKPGHEEVAEAELIAFCRERLAGFKAPKKVVFGELPKTSTGKVQKFLLRRRAKESG